MTIACALSTKYSSKVKVRPIVGTQKNHDHGLSILFKIGDMIR
jgi:hypothetical protein